MGTEVLRAQGYQERLSALEAELSRREAECHSAERSDPVELRREANEALHRGDAQRAVDLYTQALQLATTGAVAHGETVTLYANRAQAYLRLRRWERAVGDAKQALALDPTHVKAWHRCALGHLEMHHFAEAVRACRAGQAALVKAGDRSTTFQALLAQVSTTGAMHGCLDAFDGRVLHVRNAGEDAWLCQIAPPSAEDDADTYGIDSLPGDQPAGLLAGDDLDVWAGVAAVPGADLQVARAEAAAAAVRRRAAAVGKRLSYRCVQDAMAAARDGDVILVERGHHNVAGTTIEVNKRVLIRGEGAFGEASMEQRSNCPLMRVTAPAVIQNLSLELCGFRECLLFEGDARNTALLQDCSVQATGEHGIVVAGAASPTVRRVDVTAKKAGLLTLDKATPTLLICTLKDCGAQGVRACEASQPQLQGCTLTANASEGLVAMDGARVRLSRCRLTSNAGPGVDVSAHARVDCLECHVTGNKGGLFLWDAASAVLQKCNLDGGPHHAVLADGDTSCEATACVVTGDVTATRPEGIGSLTPSGLQQHGNTLRRGTPATVPPEEGCFKFEADRFTRKQ